MVEARAADPVEPGLSLSPEARPETASGRALPRMGWLDYGRLIAALFVMLDHYCFVALDPRINAQILPYGPLTQVFSNGMVGLYFFFIASGLVIFPLAQRQSVRAFAARRIARVYPIYLLAMILTTIASQYGPPGSAVGPSRFLADLLMAGPMFGIKHVDAVYWTLVVEIQFYAAILVLKLTGLLRHPQRVVTVWTGLLVLSQGLQIELPLLGTNFHCLAAGAVLSLVYQRQNLRLNFALLALIAAMCMVDAYRYSVAVSIAPLPFVALTAALFPAFLLLRGCEWRLPFAQRIGSLTYPLYLLHFHIGLVVISHFGTEANKYLLVTVLCLGMIAASAAIDEVMEMRLRRYWTRLADRTLALFARLLHDTGVALRIVSVPRQ